MEFLDPQARRRHRIRLIIGYVLMGSLISMITIILVFQAYGFDVNRKTGEVIQNGLIFVDSAPDRASVSFNNQEQKNRTNNRFSLPSGDYDVRIKKDGYRDWNRKFTLDGGEVERFTYPLLIPSTLAPAEQVGFEAVPTISTESPDRRWMLVSKPGSLTSYIEYDLNSVNDNNARPDSREFAVPAGVLSASTVSQTLEVVEWANDNKHVLLKHVYDGKTEFVIISRDQPDTSINISTLLGQNPDSITLKDKKFDQWFIYTTQGGVLQSAKADKTITPVLTNVTAFKSHGDDTLLYAQATTDGKSQRISMLQDKTSYSIKDVNNGPTYLDVARYDGAWYLIVGSDGDQKTYIYRDPQSVLDKKDGTKLTPITVLRSQGALLAVSFSQNTRFMTAQSGKHFEIYDAESKQNFKYDIPEALDAGSKVTWMDGHRLMARINNKVTIFDFDGSNKQTLVDALPGTSILFDRDYTVLYSIANNTATKPTLYSTNLRLPEDR